MVTLSSTLSLKSVPYVPKFICNLLFVSKLTEDSNCRVTLFGSHCMFQDQSSGMMIGNARMIDGLYYFDDEVSKGKKSRGLSSIISLSIKDQIVLYTLRHPSFLYLKRLFPIFFRELDCSTFHCESCSLSRSHKSFLSLTTL